MDIKKKLPENFDKNAYLDLNPDVAKAGVDAESHYLNYGINEGRKYTYISTMEISKNVNVHLTNLIENEYSNKYSFLNPIRAGDSAWVGHTYFVNFLISIIKPKKFVELGIHYGYSYFNICEIIEILRSKIDNFIETKAYGIDSFEGDIHAVFNEEGKNVENHVNGLNEKYSYFSEIIKANFDTALSNFEDKSIDLLHIDGQHLYEDVKNDFEKWKSKLSDNSVVIFHDTQIKNRNFGVYKFWNEIKNNFPSINFIHSAGLGVLFYGKKINKSTEIFLEFISNENNKNLVINFYKNLFESTNYNSQIFLLEKTKKETLYQNIENTKNNKTKIAIISDEIYNSNFDVRIKKIYDFYQRKNDSIIVNHFYESLFETNLVDHYDIFIFSRLLKQEQTLNIIETIKEKGKKIIYDIDDYLIGTIPKFLNSSEETSEMEKGRVELTKQLINKADLVTVGTNEIEKKLKLFNENTFVLHNGIDANIINNIDQHNNDRKLSILLASTDTVDVSMLAEPLNLILKSDNCELKVIGPISKQVKEITNHSNIFYYENMSYPEFLIFLANQKNTIGLIPLDDSEFSSCKTPIKYINYSSLGIPCICSNVKPYNEIIQNEFNGFLADKTEDWVKYFNFLQNIDNRKKIILNSEKNIKENYTYNSLILKIDEILKRVS